MFKKRRIDWRELAQTCIESGMTTYAWCKENRIPYSTCRGWISCIANEVQHLEGESYKAGIWGKIDITGITNLPSSEEEQSLKLQCGSWSLEIKQGFDPVLLIQVMRVVESQC
jgi:hypothetical protein